MATATLLDGLVDFSQKSLLGMWIWFSCASIGMDGQLTKNNSIGMLHCLQPDILELENITNTNTEYHNKILTRLFGGRSQTACYFLAATIFSIGIVRDLLYERALRHQPTHPLLDTDLATYAGYALLACGNILVVSSTCALGITGTFLGDYFGILMDDIVTGFPFNIMDAPMYYGSTMSFVGSALIYGKPAGLLLSAWVLVVYLVALRFENPFTAGIYAKRDRERAAAAKKDDKKEL